jgi:pimeloyl-ACP methyl ester carboxylesterase
LILGGASPYLNGMTPPYRKGEPPPPDPLLEIMRRGAEEGIEAMIEGYRIWAGGTVHPSSVERLRAVDPRAMMAFFEFSWDDEALDDVLPTMTMPCLLYIGDQDDPEHVLTYAKLMPNVSTLVLPGLNHAQTSAAVDMIVPRALEFLATGK